MMRYKLHPEENEMQDKDFTCFVSEYSYISNTLKNDVVINIAHISTQGGVELWKR